MQMADNENPELESSCEITYLRKISISFQQPIDENKTSE